MDEVWKPIDGYNGLYAVNNMGRVYSLRRNKILKPRRMPTGYLRVNLPSPKLSQRDVYIHRLVADAFCEHPEGCDVVNHIDNDPANNRADNLEWCTQRDNVIYAMEQGRVPRYPNNIRVVGIKDGVREEYRSMQEAEKHTGCYHKSIAKSCRTGRPLRNGYRWERVAYG